VGLVGYPFFYAYVITDAARFTPREVRRAAGAVAGSGLGHALGGKRFKLVGADEIVVLKRRLINLADDAVFIGAVGPGGIKCFRLLVKGCIIKALCAFCPAIGAVKRILTSCGYYEWS
jgi:hypothetical protein